ncbi:MAG: ABC transporter substrate-binding protein [Thermodesulfovibrionales bacterium]|nr:ABC transporter substrate-binding protein [Thermodesulfovibrionales bacterium]
MFFKFFLLLAIFLVVNNQPLYGGEPTNQLKQTIDKVIEILNNKELKKPNKSEERRALLRKVTDERFDYEEMAKRALSVHWAKRTLQERKEFVTLFKDLLERSYMNKIEGYSDEVILYVSETIESDYSIVKTKIITKRNIEIPIDYKLFKTRGDWKIYDVSIEGVSLVSNYRNQFNKIIRAHSYEELVKRLRSKREEILFEEKAK